MKKTKIIISLLINRNTKIPHPNLGDRSSNCCPEGYEIKTNAIITYSGKPGGSFHSQMARYLGVAGNEE